MGEFFYHGVWRMDWGLGNPNKTAALIAMLMVAIWYLASVRKWGFWLSLAVFTVLGVGLVHTFSRGGIIALFFGLAPVLYFAPRPWPRKKIIGAIVAIWAIMGASIYLDASERYEQGVVKEDRSITNRLEIWKAAPHMMVDAPSGWGLGKSGESFIQWYQPLDQTETYRTLVNSHLTWLVELGWPLRFIYVLAWLTVFLLCWPASELRLNSIALGTWVAFCVAATFSSVAESVWLWVLPAIGLGVVLIQRVRTKAWPKPLFWLIPPCLSAVFIATFLILGRDNGEIRWEGGYLVLGKGEPKYWVLVDDKVMGGRYGHTFRQFLPKLPKPDIAIAIIPPATTFPNIASETIVFAGKSFTRDDVKLAMANGKQIVFLNPAISPEELDLTQESATRAIVVFGEFSESPALSSWNGYGARRLSGIGDYVPYWPELVWQIQK